ncbi:hypothetical protein [Nonomuraea sp. NPDC001699]
MSWSSCGLTVVPWTRLQVRAAGGWVSRHRWSVAAGSRRSARATASTTCADGLDSRPCSNRT